MALGICMDLNAQPPADWTLEEGPYELAEHCIAKQADVLVLLNAWLDSELAPESEKDWGTLNYWAARLRPLWARTEDLEDEGSDSDSASASASEADGDGETSEQENETAAPRHQHPGHETIVIVCNRCGQENGGPSSSMHSIRGPSCSSSRFIGTTFAGSSAAFSLSRGSGRPKLLYAMGRKTEDVAIWTV